VDEGCAVEHLLTPCLPPRWLFMRIVLAEFRDEPVHCTLRNHRKQKPVDHVNRCSTIEIPFESFTPHAVVWQYHSASSVHRRARARTHMKSRGRITRTLRSGWTIGHRTLHTRTRIMSRGRISRRPAQETGAAAFSRRCKGPARCRAGRARDRLGPTGDTRSAGEGRGTPHTPQGQWGEVSG
jgi:hypothetical protein